uniref:Uncharacterized protein n=1 Tax=Nelumbo nucifera TaxID=4432 RepID=A0A822XHG9_NELNU|nr:TPA_asm: hypothetical protein HUJ06_021293 [Nelumbo nucifera]
MVRWDENIILKIWNVGSHQIGATPLRNESRAMAVRWCDGMRISFSKYGIDPNSNHLYPPSSPTKVTFLAVIVFVFSGENSKDRLLSSSSLAKVIFLVVIVFVFSGEDSKDRKDKLCLRFRWLLSSNLRQQGQVIVFFFSGEGNVSGGFVSQ